MGKAKYLLSRVKSTIKDEGVISLFSKTYRYTVYHLSESGKKKYKDILFINGCALPHPERYRVDHQIEQLEANGLSADKVFYNQLQIDKLKYYRGFVFFRCPITPGIEEFIKKAHYFNKKVFFDIDDLVINKKYTDTVPYVQSMSQEDKKLYDDGVERMEKTLKLCDYCITTTDALARELKTYKKEVFINRNVASEKMVKLSQEALINTIHDESIKIGYLSGSITHNPDFELIKKPLLDILEHYKNTKLVIGGLLDLPKEFDKYSDRIISKPFGDWKKLPELIASLDINLAPLEKNIFNEAKSENKWTEAALCKVVTVASDFGAFHTMIKNKKTGILCSSEKDWFDALAFLIENPDSRRNIANSAYKEAMENGITTYSGKNLSNFLESKLSKNIAFVLPSTNISGGVNVVIKHCNILRKNGFDVTIINEDKDEENIKNSDGEINVISKTKYKIIARFNTMVATLYTTLKYIKEYPEVKNRLYLVQGFETDFSDYGADEKRTANATYNSWTDIKYITISSWCKKWLKEKFDKDAKIAKNGIDLEKFKERHRTFDGKIKILIEGNSDDTYKNVDESFRIVEKLDKDKFDISYLSYQSEPKSWYHVDHFYHQIPHDKIGEIYSSCDILLKTSILESFSYPPLEMMATGGFCVVAPNEGNTEYLVDEKNCLFYKQGNIGDAIEKIERIASDEKLRKTLEKNSKICVESRDWKNLEEDILALYD